MDDQPSNWVRTAPGVPVIRNVNWGGLKTLYVKEVRRFFKGGRCGSALQSSFDAAWTGMQPIC